MQMDQVVLDRHRRALDAATTIIRDVRPDQLDRPSPCAGWGLRALLEHMVGQNHGFADAVEGIEDVPAAAFAPRPFADAELVGAWQASADRIAAAFAAAPAERDVLLVEISTQQRFPVATVLGFHLLDTVVHTWDVATTAGRRFRPADDLAELVAGQAAMVPAGPAREQPDAAFAPAEAVPPGTDPWVTALALLGRQA